MRHLTGQIVARRRGIAGQYSLDVITNYWHEDGTTESHPVTFVGSVYGAPVVMVMGDGTQAPVSDWRQYGETLDSEWVARFYGARWITAKTFSTAS